MDIEDIRDAVRNGRVKVTDHADGEALEDQITASELRSSVLSGEIIEDYPDDIPYPSCLIYGMTSEGNPVHSVWGYGVDKREATLITLYRPDPGRWIDWRTRRPRDSEIG